LEEIGTNDVGTDLTDTIILLQLDPNTDAAAMLSFPRDLVVERCDGSRGRINAAYFIGEEQAEGFGAKCLVDTITALTRIEIDHYARVNFAGFVRTVDALGGVEFHVEEPLQDRFSGLDIPAGCVTFDGVGAIQFVRARRIDSDFGRIARQQRFAREMINKATSVGTLANPSRVVSLISSISDVIETDTDFGVAEMADLVSSVQGISSGAVDGRTVPAVEGSLGEADVVYAIEAAAEALYAAFRNGELLPNDVGIGGAPVALGPANVIPIEVQNGSSTEGLAADTAEVLEVRGFTVGGTGTAEDYNFSASVVLHPPDREDHAEILAEALGGLAVNAGGEAVDSLTLILGSAFDPDRFAPEEVDAPPSDDEGGAADVVDASATEEEFVGAEVSDVQC
jgi:LCP family protein required for cell wall assembly